MNDHIHFAYEIKGDGSGEALPLDVAGEALRDDRLAWVHLDADHPKTHEWLSKELDYLDPFVVSALTADETRPRMTAIGDGVIVILRGVNLNPGADTEDMVSLRLFIDANRIISLQIRNVRAVTDIKTMLDKKRGPKNTEDFLCRLIARLMVHFETVLSDLDELTDATEETLLTKADTALRHDTVNIRRKAIKLRRHMAPQREAISQLRMAEFDWLSQEGKRALYENYNNVVRYVEELDAIRERAQIVKDELANSIADRMGKNTYILSVIAAIFLPLGFLTGLLGINIGGIPGVDNPIAFTVFCVFLTLVVAAQIVIFRKLKWF